MNARPGLGFTMAAVTLGFANFAAVTTEFIVPGILAPMAKDLGETVETTSNLVTYFALAAGLAGPPVAAIATRLPPRILLVAAMLLFTVSNLVIAFASDYMLMVIARIAQGCALPGLVSTASTSLAELAGPQRTGKAVSVLYIGVTAATVLGVPAGVFITEGVHWRVVFIGLAVLCLASAFLIGLTLPHTGRQQPHTAVPQFHLIKCRTFLLHLLLSTILFAAMFCGYTYLPAYLEQTAGLSGTEVGTLLLAFGMAGLTGNWLAGRVADYRPFEAAAIAACVLGISMSGIPALVQYLPLLVVLILLWGVAHSSVFVLNQVRVMNAGHRAASFAASLNISACNLGISMGAMAGAWALSSYGANAPALLGACIAGFAAALSVCMKLFTRFDHPEQAEKIVP